MSISIACSPTLRWASASAIVGSAGRAFRPSRPARNSSRQAAIRPAGWPDSRASRSSDSPRSSELLLAPGRPAHLALACGCALGALVFLHSCARPVSLSGGCRHRRAPAVAGLEHGEIRACVAKGPHNVDYIQATVLCLPRDGVVHPHSVPR